jgi:hypothetical protein
MQGKFGKSGIVGIIIPLLQEKEIKPVGTKPQGADKKQVVQITHIKEGVHKKPEALDGTEKSVLPDIKPHRLHRHGIPPHMDLHKVVKTPLIVEQ